MLGKRYDEEFCELSLEGDQSRETRSKRELLEKEVCHMLTSDGTGQAVRGSSVLMMLHISLIPYKTNEYSDGECELYWVLGRFARVGRSQRAAR